MQFLQFLQFGGGVGLDEVDELVAPPKCVAELGLSHFEDN
jgi:hypothetical protein